MTISLLKNRSFLTCIIFAAVTGSLIGCGSSSAEPPPSAEINTSDGTVDAAEEEAPNGVSRPESDKDQPTTPAPAASATGAGLYDELETANERSNRNATPVTPVKVEPLEEFTNSIGMKFRLIPAGTFTMGSPPDEEASTEDESQHKVTISQPFYLGIYEVTQTQYEQIMGVNPSYHQGDRIAERHPKTNRKISDVDSDNLPVDRVRGVDAKEFCRRLSMLEQESAKGIVYRLPTEEEWEYSCRAGGGTTFSNGNNRHWLSTYAWYSQNANSRTHQVGTKTPNRWGLHDMHGNVSEWCSLPRHAGLRTEGRPEDELTLLINLPITRPLRGGSIFDGPEDLRSANRSFSSGGSRTRGFRIAFNEAPDQQALEAAKIRMLPIRKNSIGMEFKSLPAGTFKMGSDFIRIRVETDSDSGIQIIDMSDAPVRTATIPESFEIGVFEVSQNHWHAVMDGAEIDGHSDHPKDVSWESANEFCRRLTEIQAEKEAGYRYRLPTEAEWEYACRAGTKSLFNFGDDFAAWQFHEKMPKVFKSEVAPSSHSANSTANPWGIYHMHGNFAEWCSDVFTRKSGNVEHVVRGTSNSVAVKTAGLGRYDLLEETRSRNLSEVKASAMRGISAHRMGVGDYRDLEIGFRVVRTKDKLAIEEANRNARYAEAAAVVTDIVKKNPVLKNSIGMSFKEIPPGQFIMGQSGPLTREVSIDERFEMSLFEVTQFDFERVMGNNPSYRIERGFFGSGRWPVDRVSYDAAVEFCKKLTSREEERLAGYTYRLPSEKEWEYVCRAGSQTRYFWGRETSRMTQHAWCDENTDGRLQAVGLKKPNPWGFFDMYGNAWELCSDRWSLFSRNRVLRGGDINSMEVDSLLREYFVLSGERNSGFRVVRIKAN